MRLCDLYTGVTIAPDSAFASLQERLDAIVQTTKFTELQIRGYSAATERVFVDCELGGVGFGVGIPVELIESQGITDNQLAAILAFFKSGKDGEILGSRDLVASGFHGAAIAQSKPIDTGA